MSGGSFDYAYSRVNSFVEELTDKVNKSEIELNPETAYALGEIAGVASIVARLMRETEWFYSGDHSEESFMKLIRPLLATLDQKSVSSER